MIKKRKAKQSVDIKLGRYEARCSNCTAIFWTKRYEDTQRHLQLWQLADVERPRRTTNEGGSEGMQKRKLQIKLKKPGSFTAYCKRKGFKGVTMACIKMGLRSKNPLTRKRALFALNFGKRKKR